MVAPALNTPLAYVTASHHTYHVLAPENTRISVSQGELVAIPLYDGTLVPSREWKTVLQYVGLASAPAVQHIRTAAGSAASRRLALFRVIGAPGGGATVQVRLALPDLHETCVSCRTVHYFIHVR